MAKSDEDRAVRFQAPEDIMIKIHALEMVTGLKQTEVELMCCSIGVALLYNAIVPALNPQSPLVEGLFRQQSPKFVEDVSLAIAPLSEASAKS
jgi:hypothetical protein